RGETSTRYTRDGSFLVTKEGILVDSEGHRVQGEGGDIQIPTDAKNVVISNDGTVTADGVIVDRLKITDFADYDYIVKVGDNMYTVVDGATEKEANASVMQGYIEMSNVNVVSEMVDMITITRAYEANQKVIRSMDSMLERAANQVGKLG
ncbi:MAG: flagellar hook-basal body protein, partial [Eubacterium sp.]|nr:flagellar hook-basal body protein [Eubacterium sp.]